MTLFDQTVPVYRQGLKMLSGLLGKAGEHAAGDGLLNAKLADDMHPLAVQIRFLSNQPGEAMARLTGREFTSRDTDETTLASARSVLASMDGFLAGIDASELCSSDTQHVVDLPNGMQFTLSADEYVRDWSMPNFYFHLTTAYAILRKEGLAIGKADFLPHMGKYFTKTPAG